MKCIAVDCNQDAVDGEYCCNTHLALIVKFRKSFDNPQLASFALQFTHPSLYPTIEVDFINLSKEIDVVNK